MNKCARCGCLLNEPEFGEAVMMEEMYRAQFKDWKNKSTQRFRICGDCHAALRILKSMDDEQEGLAHAGH